MNTFIIDIDGVICHAPNNPDGSYDYPNAHPVTSVIKRINQLYDDGNTIILLTARGYRTFNGDLEKIKEFHEPIFIEWLKKHNVKHHKLIMGKPWGPNPIYVDDRGLSLHSFLTANSEFFENIIKAENAI